MDIIAQKLSKQTACFGEFLSLPLRNPIVVDTLISTGQAQHCQFLMRSAKNTYLEIKNVNCENKTEH